MGLQDNAHGLQLDNDCRFHEQIKPVAPNRFSPIPHIHLELSLKLDAAEIKFDLERFLVNRLEKARTECRVHGDCGANHST
jgi:hypothetical protein